MKKNFDKLNDMLFIKFEQVEDNKQAVRDMLTYQKYFYPLQMQVIVGENMMELGAAMKDQPYVQYQQKRYEGLLSEVQGHMERNKGVPDKELNKLID